MIYTFPAVFKEDRMDPEFINVIFPDIPSGTTCGCGRDDAFFMAQDCLMLILETQLEMRHVVPTPIKLLKEQYPFDEVRLISVELFDDF